MSRNRTAVPTLTPWDRRAVLGLALGAASLAVPSPTRAQEEVHREALTFIRIGTGPSAETLYGLGTAISAGISRPPGGSPCDEGGICGVPGLIAVAQSRGGSLQNIRDMRDGLLESALVHADMAYWAYTGSGPFSEDLGVPDLRVVANLIPVSLHVVVRADSGIDSIRSLRDKVVSLGGPGSGTTRFANMLLRLHGLTRADIHPLSLPSGVAADLLVQGEIDALFEMGAPPIDAISELRDEVDIRLLPIEPNALQTLLGFFPFLRSAPFNPALYRIQEEPFKTVKLGVQWVVRSTMDADLVEAITKALWRSDTANVFNLNNPGHTFPTVSEGMEKGLIPFHPGAQAYYDSLLPSG